MFLPRALSATTDAQNALERLKKVFHADLRQEDPFRVNPQQKLAVEVKRATWEWEIGNEAQMKDDKANKKGKKHTESLEDRAAEQNEIKDTAPFRVKDIEMSIARGSLVAIVGSVGSGKVCLG